MEQDDLTARIDRTQRPLSGGYGDRRAAEGAASWVLWDLASGRVLPGRYRSLAEAEAARGGLDDRLPCIEYAWDGAD